jgi:hypothetical protein
MGTKMKDGDLEAMKRKRDEEKREAERRAM